MNAIAPAATKAPATPEHDALRAEIRAEIEGDVTLTQIGVAKQIGKAETTVSLWLNGKYTGDNAGVASALRAWLDKRQRDSRTRSVIGDDNVWIETPTARMIYSRLSACHTLRDFSLIYGAPGVSKTATAEHYRATYRNVWIITVRPVTSSLSAFLAECVRQLKGEGRVGGNTRNLSQAIIDHIAGSDGLLIVDEAQFLSKLALDELRSMHDASKTAVCLTGNQMVYAKTHGDGHSDAFAQLIRRIKLKTKIGKPTKADVRGIAAHYGVEQKPELEVLEDIAATPGALSHVVAAIQSVKLAPDFTGTVTADALAAVAKEFAVYGE